MVCAVGTGPDDLRDEVRFPTSSPDECLPQVIDYFTTWQAEHGEQLAAIGYGTFGPCDPHPDSPTYGWVTKTPKPGWTDTDVVGPLQRRVRRPDRVRHRRQRRRARASTCGVPPRTSTRSST